MADEVPKGDPEIGRIMAQLAAPFPEAVIKYRAGASSRDNGKAMALAYIDARDVMERLDRVLGAHGWCSDLEPLPSGQMLCKLTIQIQDSKGVTHTAWRTDLGGQSDQQDAQDKIKAAASDSLKRAAIQFGIGRYIYWLESPWVKAEFGNDGKCKKLLERPKLPEWALPNAANAERPAGQPERPQADASAPAQQPQQKPADQPAAGGSVLSGAIKKVTDDQIARMDHLFQRLEDKGNAALKRIFEKHQIADIRDLRETDAKSVIEATEKWLRDKNIQF